MKIHSPIEIKVASEEGKIPHGTCLIIIIQIPKLPHQVIPLRLVFINQGNIHQNGFGSA